METSAMSSAGTYTKRALTIGILLFLLLPLAVIVPMSFSTAVGLKFPPPSLGTGLWGEFFESLKWRSAIITSFQVALGAALLASIWGTMAAYALQLHRVPFRALFRSLMILPLITPLIVVAVALYRDFLQFGLVNTKTGMILAHSTLGIPFVMLTVVASIKRLDPDIRRAALSLGAKPWSAFRKVTFPAIRGGVFAGSAIAFIFSFNEAVVAIFLVASRNETLPKVMWDGILLSIDPVISVVATLMTGLTLCLLLVYLFVQRSAQTKSGVTPPRQIQPGSPSTEART